MLKPASLIQPPKQIIQECYMHRILQFSLPKHILISTIKPLRTSAAGVALAVITTLAVPIQAATELPILRDGKYCRPEYRKVEKIAFHDPAVPIHNRQSTPGGCVLPKHTAGSTLEGTNSVVYLLGRFHTELSPDATTRHPIYHSWLEVAGTSGDVAYM